MKADVHLVFPGNCREAFAFYEATFGSKPMMLMTYGEAPGAPPDDEMKDKVIHTSMPLGGIVLMGCDAPKHRSEPMGGFNLSISSSDEAEVKKWFAALSEGGSVQMPMTPTFWSPLFGMCKDKFGVAWMIGMPGPQA